ncbi:MAG: double-strand break repair protein AddB [Hyphomicrobiales bacterium]|nr:double-strand break repair protein AddB [Hyphomicrobiales bacterium]
MATAPRVFTIPASAPFVPTLIRALIDGTLVGGFPATRDPLALAHATLYLPTRRACRLARDLFLDVTQERAAILPHIVAIGDVDEDEIAFAQAATGALAADALALPPELGGLERRLKLARLVLKWAAQIAPDARGEAALVANNPASALALADDLARLMDDMTTRGVAWDRLDGLVPETLDRYWQLTLEFLQIARENWPKILAERGAIEPAARRDALIKAEAARLSSHTGGPVIAAGSTGSMPATAELIAAIAKLARGAVVLPGLDVALDAQSWELIGGRGDGDARVAPAVEHPQFAMQALLRRIGIAREEVVALGTSSARERERYISEALRPAAATERWQRLAACDVPLPIERALETVAVIEAANAEEEALAIAISLREALETPHKTAALITPDRALARRVVAALERWKIAVDDSGGDALADTAAGRFARLAADAALGGLAPVALLALLKHSLARLGAAAGAHARAIAALEKAILRGPRPRPGMSGLAHALAAFRAELDKLRRGEASDLHPSDPRASVSAAELDAAAALLARLTSALAPLDGLTSTPFAKFAERHRSVIAALSVDETGAAAAFLGPDGVALDAAFEEIGRRAADADFAVAPADYADVFRTAISDRTVRERELRGARLRIYGPLEARLQSVDRVVLGGLVEGVWPPEMRSDPWLSRPMRHALGLDLPERRMSLSAHDFAQALGAPDVILAYPAKLAGAPTVISRFVQRLAAVAGEEHWNRARARGAKYLAWARALDRPAEVKRIEKPAPKPPRAARPSALSVTDIENWLRDPYTIYAKHILKLRELDPIDLPPGAADRGIVIHAALSDFTKAFATGLPTDPAGALIDIGAKHFATLEDYPEARAFWWPRFRRIARWFAGWETLRRGSVATLAAEVSGKIDIALGERVFTLRARADRIERLAGGGYAILDYKTGQVPSEKQVRIGVSPQLTLEAAILRGGGFRDIPAGASVAELVYVSLKGGDPAGDGVPIDFKDGDANVHGDRALAKLKLVATRFEDEQQPYLPLVLSMWKSRYGAYDHLARVKEWSVGGPDDAESAE